MVLAIRNFTTCSETAAPTKSSATSFASLGLRRRRMGEIHDLLKETFNLTPASPETRDHFIEFAQSD
jgi:hypothetical protein